MMLGIFTRLRVNVACGDLTQIVRKYASTCASSVAFANWYDNDTHLYSQENSTDSFGLSK